MADYSAILTAIDTAIRTGAAFPLELSDAGKTTRFHSLTELIAARKYYTALQAGRGNIRSGFKVANFRPGGGY